MKRTQLLWATLAWLVTAGYAGCGRPKLPEGPAPEYERPRPMAWDAAPAVDPMEFAEEGGGWVDDEPPARLGAAGAPAEPSPEGSLEP